MLDLQNSGRAWPGHEQDRGSMARGLAVRLMAAALLVAAEVAAVSAVLVVAPAPAEAQFLFGDRFPFFGFGHNNNRRGGGWFGAPQQQDNSQYVDSSRAPAATPRKPDAPPVQTPILVIGDAMADWLGYGLEQAFADTPEIGILRRHRTLSGLIRADVRSDPRGDYPDWPQAARELIASQKPKFVVIMLGLNDRRSIREVVQATRAKPAQPATPDNDPALRELDQPAAKPAPEAAVAPDAATPATTTKIYDFRSDAWSEAYIKRIDDTIAALKTSGVPIFWVGLPPIRSGRNAGDIPFLNELYRSRADKAGIVYVDVWDGFVDDDGRFAQTGPDFEGQTRRLRSGDGMYFTQPGARKLAHFVEKEIDRWLTARPVALAVPAEEPKAAAPAPADIAPAAAPGKPASNSKARPLAGPALPLISEPADDSGELLGGGKARPSAVTDAVAAKVLVKGETMAAPAGRADDFSWPRRNVAPLGADPTVATTELPMTPMVADRTTGPAKPADAATDPAAAQAAAAKQVAQQQAAQRTRSATSYQTQYRPSIFGGGRGGSFFPFLFGGGR
jgi:hypothetical protein